MDDTSPHAELQRAAWAHAPALRRYADSLLRHRAAAEDCVQDVMCKLVAGAFTSASADDAGGLRAQLFAATRNRCIDWLRKENRMTALAELDGQVAPERQASPTLRLAVADEAEAALAALDKLPTLQRDALRLRFSGGLSYKQIAVAMDKSVSHVGVLIHEGLTTLRQQLA